ncbi:MAG: PhzF family phenazine biosynthesis protein [Acidobacteria bacterium]|nr:PhzF family phenazine biosynthesis protein [Acidobacteriota bacterium]
MPLAYLHYDVFTTDPLAGNQLAVFLDGRGVPVARMQAIAREMNFSESTFILPPETAGTDVRMRIFTPANEMPMAGHPTIGSTFALAHAGVIRPGASRFVFGLGVGPVPVDLEWDGSRLRFAWMTQLDPAFGPAVDARDAVASAIGLDAADLAPDLPVQQVSCGVPFLLVPLRDRERVDRAISDASAFRRLALATGIDLPIFLFSWGGSRGETSSHRAADPPTVYSRMFAPEFGIIEDPATGSACGPLGCYLVRHQLITGDAATRMLNLQGVAMGRPSRIHIAIGERDGAIVEVKVGGAAVLVGQGELLI